MRVLTSVFAGLAIVAGSFSSAAIAQRTVGEERAMEEARRQEQDPNYRRQVEQARAQAQQALSVFQSQTFLKLAHDKCANLTPLTLAAVEDSLWRSKSLVIRADVASDEQLNAVEADITSGLQEYNCNDLLTDPAFQTVQNAAKDKRDMSLMFWNSYAGYAEPLAERYAGSFTSDHRDCIFVGLRDVLAIAPLAQAAQTRLSSRPEFNQIKPSIDAAAQALATVCYDKKTDENFMEMDRHPEVHMLDAAVALVGRASVSNP